MSVFRRPIGNRIEPKLCGTMANRGLATALVSQLMRAESVVRDLFLEATDDGIEALEAVLEACRKAVVEGRSSGGRRGRNRNRRRREGPADRGGEPSFDEG